MRSVANAGSSERGRRENAIVSVSPSSGADPRGGDGARTGLSGSSSDDPAAASAPIAASTQNMRTRW